MTEAVNVLVVTTENIPGQEYEVIGEVFGLTTQSKNVVKNIGAGLKNIVGGEIKAYTELLSEARDIAVTRLRANAAAMGADAVVMMRYDSDSISQDMETVAAYGTAVKFK
ncbi:heavy metal-binding domain-containing protein [Furfurilactobacillus entadae]|uniref:heavy metal-binding domain-containing protein n=1 Tax=Furfurilactobacillus entadae TaxID=2922307 RepID=UPI0035E925F4